MCIEKMFETFKNALLNPKQTFKKEKKKANLGLGAKYILVAGAIAGLITGLATLNPITAITNLVIFSILQLLGWLIASGILYLFARMLGGKGNFDTQSYLMALYMAPMSVLTAIIAIIPIIGPWLSLLVSLYGLYLLTLSLKEAHNYSTGRAVLTWLLPAIIIAFMFAVLIGMAFMAYMSSVGDLNSLLATLPEGMV